MKVCVLPGTKEEREQQIYKSKDVIFKILSENRLVLLLSGNWIIQKLKRCKSNPLLVTNQHNILAEVDRGDSGWKEVKKRNHLYKQKKWHQVNHCGSIRELHSISKWGVHVDPKQVKELNKETPRKTLRANIKS